MAAITFESLKQQIRQKKLAPVYILHGGEGYYIDEIVKEFEGVLPPEEREFNQYVLYAPEVAPGTVMDLCTGYPMMAERQVVILKEAQAAKADQINRLHRYVEHPSPTTVFVIVFRGGEMKGKDLIAAAKKGAVVFESKKLQDYQLAPVITAYVKQKGLTPDPKAVEMLRDFIGANLSHLFNEIDKVAQLLPQGAALTPDAVERNIGISKEYNNFELVDALAAKDAAKAMRISRYFAANPKAAPLEMTVAALYNYFSDLLIAFYSKDKSEHGLMEALKIKWPIQVKKFVNGMRSYNAFQVIEIIWALRQFDARSKGSGSRQNRNDLFNDLVFHILTAPGNLGV